MNRFSALILILTASSALAQTQSSRPETAPIRPGDKVVTTLDIRLERMTFNEAFGMQISTSELPVFGHRVTMPSGNRCLLFRATSLTDTRTDLVLELPDSDFNSLTITPRRWEITSDDTTARVNRKSEGAIVMHSAVLMRVFAGDKAVSFALACRDKKEALTGAVVRDLMVQAQKPTVTIEMPDNPQKIHYQAPQSDSDAETRSI